jgi:outer membrane lipoprotein SlyB
LAVLKSTEASRVDPRAFKRYEKDMNRKQKNSGKIGTPPAERVANAATGAVLGAVVAGPVGALAGAAVGAMVEKGMPRRTRRKADTKEMGNKAEVGGNRNRRGSSSKPDA